MKNVEVDGVTYNGVSSVSLRTTSGSYANFIDEDETTQTVVNSVSGKIIHVDDAVTNGVQDIELFDSGGTEITAATTVCIANKNLFRIDLLSASTVSKGITFTKNADGSITANGTSTGTYASASVTLDPAIFQAGQVFTISCGKSIGDLYVQLILNYTDGTTDYLVSRTGPTVFMVPKAVSTVTASVQITASGVTLTNQTIYPQIEFAGTPSAFVMNTYSQISYNGSTMPTLPASVANLWTSSSSVASMTMTYTVDVSANTAHLQSQNDTTTAVMLTKITRPEGGTIGQVLTKIGDDEETWDDVHGLPDGGTNGQVLTHTQDGAAWRDVPQITVDSAMSSSSTNPVQNAVVKAAIDSAVATETTARQNADTALSGQISDLESDLNAFEASVTKSGNTATITITDADGTTTATVTDGTATDEQVAAWLTEHPEATTTVADGSISKAKLNSELKNTANLTSAMGVNIVLDKVEYEENTYKVVTSSAYTEIQTESYNPNNGDIITGQGTGVRRIDAYYMVAPESNLVVTLGLGVIFYDIAKNYISGFIDNSTPKKDTVLTVPENAYYARFWRSRSDVNSLNSYLSNVKVNGVTVSTDSLHTQWENVEGKESFVNSVSANTKSIGDVRTAFDISPVFLEANKFIEIQEGVVYYQYPYTNLQGEIAQAGVIRFYDDNYNQVTHTEKNNSASIAYQYQTATGKTDAAIRSDKIVKFWFEGTSLHCITGYQGEGIMTFAELPKYFKVWFDRTFTIGQSFSGGVDTDAVYLSIPDTKAVGFWEQASDKLTASLETSEFLRKTIDTSIRNANRLRHAFRFASFNIYGASKGKSNWTALKIALQNYGIDVIGFQEVSDPLGRGSNTTKFADVVGGWHLSQFSDAVSFDGSARIVASTSEFVYVGGEDVIYTTQANYGHRYYSRNEFRLPRWKGKNWSNYIKVSVYDTQLEVGTSEAYTNARLAQARQLVQAMQNDPNPFIVLVGDFNEMAIDRSTFKVISDAGFTPVLADTSTPTSFRGFYDNIFVNDRISIVNDDMIPYSDNGSGLSDHNLLMADLVFDYTNIIAVKKTGSNCTIGVEDWLDRTITEPVTIQITADEGYTVSNITVGQGDNDLTYDNGAITKDGNTITVIPNLIVGDMWISVTTTAQS